MIALFVYGTLRDAQYQEALFGRPVATRPATLAEWMPVFTETGYLTIVEAPGEAVDGDLIELDDRDLAIADAWEDVPLYIRTAVDVTAGGMRTAAWTYVSPSDARERAPDGVFSLHTREHVLAQIRQMRTNSESA